MGCLGSQESGFHRGDDGVFQIEDFCNFHEFCGVVADPKGEVMSGAFSDPAFEEGADVRFEDTVSVRIAGGRNGARGGFAFGDDEFEFAVGGLSDAEHGDGAFLDAEFHTCSRTGLAVVFFETADDRASRRNIDVVGAVVSDKHAVALEVHRVELRETAADVEPVENHHGDAGFDIEFTTHGKARAGEERVAHDEVGDKGAEFGFRFAFVVVGEAIEAFFVDEAFEGDGGACGDVEVAVGEFFGKGIGFWIRGIKEFQDPGFPGFNGGGVGGAEVFVDIARFDEDDMGAERRSDGGRIGVHVEH